MFRKLIRSVNAAILGLLLSACGSATIGINLPGGGNPPQSAPAQFDANTVILIAVGGVLLIVLAIVFTRKR